MKQLWSCVLTHMHLLSSLIIWYWSKDSDTLWLERSLQVWQKVIAVIYCWIYD